MKILYITRDLDDSGAFLLTRKLHQVLRARGEEIVFLNVQEERRAGGSRDPLTDRPLFGGPEGEQSTASGSPMKRLRHFLFHLAPHLKTLLFDGVVSVGPQLRAMRRHSPDLVVVRASGLWNTPLLAKREKIPCLLHIDGLWEAETRESWHLKLRVRIIGPLMRYLRRRYTDHFAVVTEVVRDARVQQGFDPRRFTVLNNGVDTELFHPATPPHSLYKELIDKTVVGFVGSFQSFHQVDRFLEQVPVIVRQDPSIVFMFVGKGPEWAKVRALAEHPEIAPNVIVQGAVPHEEIPTFVAGFDIGIIPFTAHSCSPLKVYEYMAMGKATIAPRWQSVEAIIDHGTDGYLFEPNDLAALNLAVIQLAQDRDLRNRLGRNARLKMEQHFTWEHWGERFRSACAAAIAANRGSSRD